MRIRILTSLPELGTWNHDHTVFNNISFEKDQILNIRTAIDNFLQPDMVDITLTNGWGTSLMKSDIEIIADDRPLVVHDIVKFRDPEQAFKDPNKAGWYKIRSIIGKKAPYANLITPNGNKIIHKKIPLTDLVEDGQAQWEAFSKSETYQSQ